MTVGAFLKDTTAQLKAVGVSSARLDCLILLEDLLGHDRASLLAHPEYELTASQSKALTQQTKERAQHIPLAYIRGKAFFYGREFIINEHVLVPRPETEMLLGMLLELPLKRAIIADIGTGSGCIGVTAALELPETTVYLYDVDPLALMTARQNAEALHAMVTTAHSNLLEDAVPQIDIILTNLPYVPTTLPVNKAATHEPALALYAGKDGLDAYRTFWHQLAGRQHRPDYVLTESLAIQHSRLAHIAAGAGYHVTATQGLIQQFEPTV